MRFVVAVAAIGLASAGWAREAFYGVYVRGKKVGYATYDSARVQFRGKLVTKSESKMVFSASFDKSATEHESDDVMWADDKFNVLCQTSVEKSSGRSVSSQADFEGRKVHIAVNNSGVRTERDLVIPADRAYEVDPYLQVTAGGKAVGKQIKTCYVSFATMSMETHEVVYVGKVKAVIRDLVVEAEQVDLIGKNYTTTEHIGADGQMLDDEGPNGAVMVAEPKEVALAKDFDPNVNIYNFTRISPERPLAQPRFLESLKISLAASNLDRANLPSDEHQTVTKTADGCEIEIHPATLGADGQTPISSLASGQEEWLKPDLNIPSDSAEFKNLALSILGGETHVGPAVRKIQSYVHHTMHIRDGISVLRNASEVLKSKEGVCRDYAVVAITLLRSAGIPAKLATGLVSWDNGFYYHEWVLAWTGKQWIGVDSMVPDEQLCASHIEMTTGAFAEVNHGALLEKPRMVVLSSRYVRLAQPLESDPSPKPTPAAIGRQPMNAKGDAALKRGDKLVAKYDLKNAEQAFRTAKKLDPKSALPYERLCQLFVIQHRVPECMSECRAGLAIWPSNYTLLRIMTACLADSSRFSEAESAALQAKKYDPDQKPYGVILGYIYYAEGKYVEAEAELRQAVSDPAMPGELRQIHAMTLYLIGHLAEAEAEAREILKTNPKSGFAYLAIASVKYGERHLADAEQAFRKAITLMQKEFAFDTLPEAYAHAGLAETLLDLNRKQEALIEAKKAQDLGLSSHEVYERLGIH